jgi:hypothetical protein
VDRGGRAPPRNLESPRTGGRACRRSKLTIPSVQGAATVK